MRKGKTTKPTLKHFEGTSIYGYSVRTCNTDERSFETAKIPALWQKFFSSPFVPHHDIYGVYSEYQSDANGLYKITAGISAEHWGSELEATTIIPGKYLVFENKGPLPETVINTWQQVWDYFAKHSEYERNYKTDFEMYTDKERVAVCIGVR